MTWATYIELATGVWTIIRGAVALQPVLRAIEWVERRLGIERPPEWH